MDNVRGLRTYSKKGSVVKECQGSVTYLLHRMVMVFKSNEVSYFKKFLYIEREYENVNAVMCVPQDTCGSERTALIVFLQ